MDLDPRFGYQPNPPNGPTPPPTPSPVPPGPPAGPDYGLLAGLEGNWAGSGFNVIWVPRNGTDTDRFLMLNRTSEQLDFSLIPGAIPNRGLLQPDVFMAGLQYLQQITDANIDPSQPAGLHAEPGVWLNVPQTSDPSVPASVARMGSVPHGAALLAQGFATSQPGPPTFPDASITPFTIGQPSSASPFPEQTLANNLPNVTSGAALNGIDQAWLDNPNSVLAPDSTVTETVTLTISSDATTPVIGGGTADTAFLVGGSDGPNADPALVSATFWLQTRPGEAEPGLLQYSQTVMLNFNGISWPHVTVANLTRAAAPAA
jgi:hypothetical protein